MKKICFLLFILLILSFTGCSKTSEPSPVPATPDNTTQIIDISTPQPPMISMSKEDFPVIDGSTATIPLSLALYKLVTNATEAEAEADIIHTKTTNSYYRLIDKEADLLIVYAPGDEVYSYLSNTNTKINMKPIGKDALVFLTNSSNPVSSLSKEQLVDIYSGKITNWFKVGGNNIDIVAFQRPDGSGSQTLMKKLVMGSTDLADGPYIYKPQTMDEIIKEIASYNNTSNAIGYSVYYYANNMYNVPDLKYIAIDGILPDNESIKTGTYPYINEFYAVVRENEPKDSSSYKIFEWLTSQEGQKLIEDTGYVSID